jgi:glutamyl-tRNA reductase
MSGLAARHLRSAGCGEVYVTNRTPERAIALAREIDGQARPFSELEALLKTVDVVLSSTGAPEPILTRAAVKAIMKQRRQRPLFLIDIAVPRDVEPAVGDLPDVFLYDVDSLQAVVAGNLRERMREAEFAERIVADEVARFSRWLGDRGVQPTIRDLRKRAEAIARAEVERTLLQLPALDERGRRSVEAMANAIVNKLLHAPTAKLKEPARGEEIAEAVRELFGLEAAEEPQGEPPAPQPQLGKVQAK